MSKEDVVQQRLETEEPPVHIANDAPLSGFLPPRASQPPASGQASSSQGALAEDLRSSAVVRPPQGEGEEQRMSKKARAEEAKQARIQRLQEEMEAPKFLGYVKGTIHYMNHVKFPKDGIGFLKQSDSKEWVFQIRAGEEIARQGNLPLVGFIYSMASHCPGQVGHRELWRCPAARKMLRHR